MADNIQVKDANGVTQTMRTTDNAGVHTAHHNANIRVGGTDVTELNPVPSSAIAERVYYWPGYTGVPSADNVRIGIDPDGGLVTRGSVLTDEGTFRINFANTSLAVSIGSVTISGNIVTGTGFLNADLHYSDYFKLDADGENRWTQIESVDSDTQLTLVSNYAGGSSGAASRALVSPYTGSGGSLSVGSGQLTLTSGTTNAAVTGVKRLVDYAPLVFRTRMSLSQRIANQTAHCGLEEDAAVNRWFARFLFDGTTNTTVKCETGRNPTVAPSAAETETTTVTLPHGQTTATLQEYRVEMLTESVRFYINGLLVAEHSRVIPSQHDEMVAHVEVINGTGAASSTTVVVDYITGKNHNKLEVGLMSDVERIVAAQVPMVPYLYNVAGVIAINTDLLIIDCLNMRGLSIQCISMGTTGVVTPAWSNDGVNWVATSIMTPLGVAAATFNAAGLWSTPVQARYFRLRLTTATTAGTTTLNVQGIQAPMGQPVAQPVSGSVSLTGTLPAIVGQTAEDSAVTGNPVRVGARAYDALPAATVINGDAIDVRASRSGQLVTKEFAPGDLDFQVNATVTTNTQTQIRAAQAAGIRQNVTQITYQNTNATATTLTIQDGSTTLITFSVPASMTNPVQLQFPTPLRGTAATVLNYTAGTTGANVLLNVTGFNSY